MDDRWKVIDEGKEEYGKRGKRRNHARKPSDWDCETHGVKDLFGVHRAGTKNKCALPGSHSARQALSEVGCGVGCRGAWMEGTNDAVHPHTHQQSNRICGKSEENCQKLEPGPQTSMNLHEPHLSTPTSETQKQTNISTTTRTLPCCSLHPQACPKPPGGFRFHPSLASDSAPAPFLVLLLLITGIPRCKLQWNCTTGPSLPYISSMLMPVPVPAPAPAHLSKCIRLDFTLDL